MDRFNFRRSSENKTPDPRFGKSRKLLVKSPNFLNSERFKPLSRQATPDYLEPISTLSKRTCTFGIGGRLELKNKTGKDSPSPCTYNLPSCFDKEKGGPVMSKPKILKRKKNENIPGPGTYNPHSPLGTRALKFSFTSRIIKEIRCESPPPNTYNPCFTLVSKGAFKNIGFGIGDRNKTPRNDSPGPGTYDLPSIFQAPLTERTSYSKESHRPPFKYNR